MNTNLGCASTARLSHACEPAPMMKKVPKTGSKAHQPGKASSRAKPMPARMSSIPIAAETSRDGSAQKAEGVGTTNERQYQWAHANRAPAMNSQNLVKGR